MKMVVGLGNPGRQYAETRHNVGFMTIDELARRHGAAEASQRMGAWSARARIAGQDVLLVKPQTFMNLSGEAVGRLWRWYKLGLEDVLIVSDDIDLPFERLRLRARGSAGGHNGLRSIFRHLGSQEIARLKIGVGRPASDEARDYVLSPFSREEREALPLLLSRAADAVELALREGAVAAMNVVNGTGGAESAASSDGPEASRRAGTQQANKQPGAQPAQEKTGAAQPSEPAGTSRIDGPQADTRRGETPRAEAGTLQAEKIDA
jgi:PTH1 family peptidyl-tRNA hydrolase